MKLSLADDELPGYVALQVNNFYPHEMVSGDHLKEYIDLALRRTAQCFAQIRNKYFNLDGEVFFNHLHTDQYAMFLYFLCNSIFRESNDSALASKVYGLNKALHGIDVFYEEELPDVFFFQHPLGTVLGRAKYSNYLVVYSRCSVGANLDDVYPYIGEGVAMYGGSAIIGDCTVGDNCWISVGTTVMDQDIPTNSAVFGKSPNTVVKTTKRSVVRDLFLP